MRYHRTHAVLLNCSFHFRDLQLDGYLHTRKTEMLSGSLYIPKNACIQQLRRSVPVANCCVVNSVTFADATSTADLF